MSKDVPVYSSDGADVTEPDATDVSSGRCRREPSNLDDESVTPSLPRRAYEYYRDAGLLSVLAAGVRISVETVPYSERILDPLHSVVHHGWTDTSNPIITADDVDDYGDCAYVADPFLIAVDDCWHLFFEVYNPDRDPDAVIGHATSTDRGRSWEYDRVVFNPGHHVSFPYVFEHGGRFHLVLESGGRGGTERTIDRYVATDFPTEWRHEQRYLTVDRSGGDTVVFEWNDRWWLVGGDSDSGLQIHHSDSLEGDRWIPHEANPVVDRGPRATRPGGRPVVHEDGILFFFQDCVGSYGSAVRVFEITDLTPSTYADRELNDSPVLGGDGFLGWRSGRMHHVDPRRIDGEWRIVADGDTAGTCLFGSRWSIGLLEEVDDAVLSARLEGDTGADLW